MDGTPDNAGTRAGRSLTRGARSQLWLGMLLTLGPVLLTFAAVYGLAWVLAERTPLAHAPEWLAWPAGVVVSALVVFGVPLGLLMWGFRNYRG